MQMEDSEMQKYIGRLEIILSNPSSLVRVVFTWFHAFLKGWHDFLGENPTAPEDVCRGA